MNETGFPINRFNEVYKDAGDVASFVTGGSQKIHKMSFEISEVTIKDVYPGSKYNDTDIFEICFINL